MKRTRLERVRLGFAVVGLIVTFVVVLLRLGQLQIVHAAEYSSIVKRQSGGKIPIPAERGKVYDRYGRIVAKNVTRQALYAHPETGQDVKAVAVYLEKLFDLPVGTAVQRYKLSANRFKWITRRLDDRLAARIEKDAPRGLYLRTETGRNYPYGSVGKQILGFTSIDNQGLSGFELMHDSLLAGRSGWADIRRDGHRNIIKVKEQALVKPDPGQSTVLTIDWQLQEVVERELSEAVEKYNAVLGMAVFMNCRTGEILAMADYDPNEKNRERPTKLRALSDQFEPGSAFKAFTASALLNADMIDFADTVYCEMGLWRMGRGRLRDDKELGWLTFRQIIELSSNIGLGKCAVLLEGDRMMNGYRDFGFGERSGLGFPGEAKGSLHRPEVWSEYNVAALAMGHSVAVTALQMAAGMSAIANGGELLRPQLILGQVDRNGRVVERTAPDRLRTPIKDEACDSLRAFLRGVVENGTGDPVNSKFVAISGKTGTAELPDLVNGGYIKNKFMASFCGFFPSHAPQVAGIVVIKDPKPITYGGHTAGKAFRHIAERYTVSNPDLFGVADQVRAEKDEDLALTREVPQFVGRDLVQAKMLAERRGLEIKCSVDSGTVVWQYPDPDRLVLGNDQVLLAVSDRPDGSLKMIDLRGLTIRKAAAFLSHAGIKHEIEGIGCVRSQSVKPGTTIKADAVCRLRCRPIG